MIVTDEDGNKYEWVDRTDPHRIWDLPWGTLTPIPKTHTFGKVVYEEDGRRVIRQGHYYLITRPDRVGYAHEDCQRPYVYVILKPVRILEDEVAGR